LPNPALRADLEHLLDLWDLLPAWEEKEFWNKLAEVEGKDDDHDTYFLDKMHSVRHLINEFLRHGGDKADHSLQYLAQYVLMFFDRDDQKMFQLLDRIVLSTSSRNAGRIGRRWAEDAVATAWRLYVPSAADVLRTGRNEHTDRPWLVPEED
jgi:hypothetical protein